MLGGRAAQGTTPAPYVNRAAELRRTLSELFVRQDKAAIEGAIAEEFPGVRVKVAFDPCAVRFAMSCAWSRTPAGQSSFTFAALERGHLLNTVVERWLSTFELFCSVDGPDSPSGRIVINFNDAGLEPGLAFSANAPGYVLIPDCDFLASRGYAEARKHFDRHSQPWDRRSAMVFWRGSAVGQRDHPLLEMPRAQLCRIALAAEAGSFDVGLVETFGLSSSDTEQLLAAGLMKNLVPWKQLNRFRFHIDIDGHANSYAGLFRKLLSGGLVFKVSSAESYRQWYYDRLKPWENYVPVRSDLGDLVEVVSYCRKHDRIARRISQNGQQLARSLSYGLELAGAVESVKRAFRAK